LQAAALCGDAELVEMLLDKGAEVNAVGGRYGTALVAAVANGHEAIAKLLVDRGAQKLQAEKWWKSVQRCKRRNRGKLTKEFLGFENF
jgi:ankyrin repeat protein